VASSGSGRGTGRFRMGTLARRAQRAHGDSGAADRGVCFPSFLTHPAGKLAGFLLPSYGPSLRYRHRPGQYQEHGWNAVG
jgi:hypothetical protein